jgi:hypothetical protein
VQSLIDSKIQLLDFGESYKKASKSLNEALDLVYSFESVKNKPDELIYDYTSRIKNRIDLVRETLINKINEASDKMIKEVDDYGKECTVNIPNLQSVASIASTKADLLSWNMNMNLLVLDEAGWKTYEEKSKLASDFLNIYTKALKQKIFLGEERKKQFDLKYLNVFDAFCSQIGFNTFV